MNNFKLIIGLGNPDRKYETTYHNVGFLAVDYFAQSLSGTKTPSWEQDPHKNYLYSEIEEYVFIKPLTFMNLSGAATATALRRFKSKPEEILVIHDDSDIELGQYKFSLGQGSAGHKGVESIITSLGIKDFYRIRVGVRKKKGKAGSFILNKMRKEDKELLNQIFEEIMDIIGLQRTL